LDALIDAAREIDPTGQAAAFLALKDCEGLRPDTALELLKAKWAADAERGNMALSEWAADKQVVIIPPIPPHVFDLICSTPHLRAASFDRHPLPPFLRHEREIVVVRSFHEARRCVGKADLVAFDAYRDGEVLARQSVIDLVGDLRTLAPGVRFAVHFRPHPDHDGDDVALPADVVTRIEEV